MNKKLKVVTIGGGSGMPIVNKALVRAGFERIKSIVTTFDSGGDSGRMRTDERGRILAFSDYWRSLMSLWKDGDQKNNWEEMLRYRDGRGRNFGNTFFQFISEKSGGLDKVDDLFVRLTQARLSGQVIPVSVEPADVCFESKSGKKYIGEHLLDDLRMSKDMVIRIWLSSSKVKGNIEALEAVRESDVVIISPGSMYGSVISNFLPKGMIEAYRQSRAKKILMTNIMSVANENHLFNQNDYVEVFKKYLKIQQPFNLVVMPDLSKLNRRSLKKILGYYRMENANPIKLTRQRGSLKVQIEDIAIIEEGNMRLRHSEEKLAQFFQTLEI